jgi:predicted DCC family thiol-disulfide oxidoreductase YuxK
MTDTNVKPVLLFDGDCGFCNASVRFILRHERQHDLLFASLQGDVGRALLDRYRIQQAGPGTAVLIQNGCPYLRSDASLRVLRLMGGKWRALGIAGMAIPKPLRDFAYNQVAKHRQSLGCSIANRAQTQNNRHRFLDEPSDNDKPKESGGSPISKEPSRLRQPEA